MGTWGLVKATRYKEAWQSFSGRRLIWALRNDQYPTTHPIVADIPDLEAADQVFDGITYAKGAAVLRQLVNWIGEDNFFTGVRAYLKENQFSNAGLADFLAALSKAAGKDVKPWVDAWLQTAGVSTVKIIRQTDGILLRQTSVDPLTDKALIRPQALQIASWKLNGNTLSKVATVRVELLEELFLSWQELGGEDVIAILPNDEALSYLKIDFDEDSRNAFLTHDVDDALARAVVNVALWQGVRDAQIPLQAYIDYVCLTPLLENSSLLAQRSENIVLGIKKFVPFSLRAQVASNFFNFAYEQYQVATENSDQKLIWARTLIAVSELFAVNTKLLKDLLDTLTDNDLRWQVLISLAGHGEVTVTDLDVELKRNNTAADVTCYLQAKASFANTRAETLQKLLYEAGQLSNSNVQALINGFTYPLHNAEAKRVFPNYFAVIDEIWERYSQEIAQRLIYGLYPNFDLTEANFNMPNDVMLEADNWLNAEHPAALRKIILDCQDDHRRQLKIQYSQLQ